MTIDPQASLAALVLDEPARAELFQRLGFDYCCQGGRSLAEACAQRGLDVDTAVEVLAVYQDPHAGDAEVEYDWRRASTGELCDHIVKVHHERLRRELPWLAETLSTVTRVHGPSERGLHDLARVFDGLRRELEAHMEREEQVLFPFLRALEAGAGVAEERELMQELEHEHADVAASLLVLRDLAGGYRREAARCATHRTLIDGLRALEHDLRQHIHEENNVLFPRVRGLVAA